MTARQQAWSRKAPLRMAEVPPFMPGLRAILVFGGGVGLSERGQSMPTKTAAIMRPFFGFGKALLLRSP
jgi:hypothetical protein